MRRIVCEECGKFYDYDRDEFCPRCGAFNQPVKTWTTDSQGNVRRVDGVNEQNHAGSFVHKEVHKEKQVRRARGMDWDGKPAQPARPAVRQQAKPKKSMSEAAKIFLWIVGIIVFINFVFPLLDLIFHLF